MSVRIFWGDYDREGNGRACMVDSVTGMAFGPLFSDAAEVEAFLVWNKATRGFDPRCCGNAHLGARLSDFRKDVEAGNA